MVLNSGHRDDFEDGLHQGMVKVPKSAPIRLDTVGESKGKPAW